MTYATFARRETEVPAPPVRSASKPALNTVRIGDPSDAYEQEADRVAAAVMKGRRMPSWSISNIKLATVQRQGPGGGPQDQPGPKPNNYDEAAKKVGEAFLKTDVAKKLIEAAKHDPLVEDAESFIGTLPGKIIAGAAAVGAVSAAATHKALPVQIPEFPLDIVKPGLSVAITYEGPVDHPTKAAITFSYSPKGKSKVPKEPASERYRETARMAAEQEKFRSTLKYKPGSPQVIQQKQEQKAVEDYVTRRFGSLPGTGGKPLIETHPGLKEPLDNGLRLPSFESPFKSKTIHVLEQQLELKPLTSANAPSESDKKEESIQVQRKAEDGTTTSGGAAAPTIVHDVLNSPGQPLDPATRRFFETRLGYDLSAVRVHTDARAASSAQAVEAEAYTFGSEIVFQAGRFAPHTFQGDRLLAHELTHTLQQRSLAPQGGMALRRQPKPPPPSTLDPADQKVVEAAQKEASNFKCNVGSVLWDILHKHFPNDVHKVAGTGCESALSGLRTEFSTTDPKDPKLTRSVPMIYAGKAFIDSTDAARLNDRVADVGKQIEAIDDWRVANFLIDDKDLSNPKVTGLLRSMSSGRLVDYKDKSKNAEVRRYTENLLSFSTPTQAGSAVDPLLGNMQLQIGGVNVVVKPDERQVAGLTGGDTKANLTLSPTNIPGFDFDAKGIVTRFPGYTPTATLEILTRYGPGASPEGTSGYGRGTTPEDVKNKATALRFHEGSHGEDYINFLRQNPIPMFTGKLGMKKTDFEAAITSFKSALSDWGKRLNRSSLSADCVGKTIDQFHAGESGYKNICP